MKAAVLYQLGKDLRICPNVEVAPPARGQVLVRLQYSGVCSSQLMEVRGRRGCDPHLPHLLGHEGSGVVQDVGEGVTKVRPGDRVVLGWIKGAGIDVPGTKYRNGGEWLNAGGVTTFNDTALVSENRCVLLPDGVPMDVGVLFGCAVPTGAGIVLNELSPPAGSSVAIFGLGGIGLSALMATRLFKLSEVIAVDIEGAKLELAREFGATHVINAGTTDTLKSIAGLTQSRGVDYSIDATGTVSGIEAAFKVIRRNGGLCVFASHPPAGEVIRLDPHDLISGKQIRGTWGGACDPDKDLPRFFDLYKQGLLPLEKLISRRYSLEQINDALTDLENHRVARPLIEFLPRSGWMT